MGGVVVVVVVALVVVVLVVMLSVGVIFVEVVPVCRNGWGRGCGRSRTGGGCAGCDVVCRCRFYGGGACLWCVSCGRGACRSGCGGRSASCSGSGASGVGVVLDVALSIPYWLVLHPNENGFCWFLMVAVGILHTKLVGTASQRE